jgi:hypothetical protein
MRPGLMASRVFGKVDQHVSDMEVGRDRYHFKHHHVCARVCILP